MPSQPPQPNPYLTLLHHPEHIPQTYHTHRTNRSAQQTSLLTAPSAHLTPDPILSALVASPHGTDPARVDPRHNIAVWARPPERVRRLVGEVQARLRKGFESAAAAATTEARADEKEKEKDGDAVQLYTPLPQHLHMTVMEVTHSRTAAEVAPLVDALTSGDAAAGLDASAESDAEGDAEGADVDDDTRRSAAAAFTALPHDNARRGRFARLEKPVLMFDANAAALAYLPVGDATSGAQTGSSAEKASADADGEKQEEEEKVLDGTPATYTYHHLRGQVYALAANAVPVASRYVLPSAHVTLARFTTCSSSSSSTTAASSSPAATAAAATAAAATAAAATAKDATQAAALVRTASEINAWLEAEIWPDAARGGSWSVGEERGLELRVGSCWYGYGGRRVRAGRGIRGCVVRAV